MRVLACIAFALMSVVPAGMSSAQTVDAEAFASRSIARMGLIDLRSFETNEPDDYSIAAEVLRLALEYAPDDVELTRRLAEAYRAAGDEDGLMQTTRQVLTLDPRDTVATLRLISHSIGQIQNVERRLIAYDRFLGPAGDRLNPSVRSRLALDAALLARDLGQDDLFASYLERATTLDSTNKEAATLAARFYSERLDDRAGRLELLINLLKADPFDPNVHFSITGVLAEGGAFEAADRFHKLGVMLLTEGGASPERRISDELLALRWRLNGPSTLLDMFQRDLTTRRAEITRQRQQLEELGEPLDDLPTPEEVRLPYEHDQFRVAAAAALGDTAEVAAALEDLEETTSKIVIDVNEQIVELGDDITSEEREYYATFLGDTASRVAMVRLIAGLDAEQAAEWIRVLRERTTVEPRRLAAIDGLVLLRSGQPGEAIDLLEPLSEMLPEASFGMAVAFEQLGDAARAAEFYDRTVAMSRLTALGMFSAARYEALTGREQGVRSDARQLARIAEVGVPRWVDNMVLNPSSFMSLQVQPVEDTIEALGQVKLRVTLQNQTQIPLAVGPDRPLNSRMLVSPRIDVDTEPLTGVAPEVFDVSYRLRLMPGERLVADLWPDPAISGWVTEMRSGSRVRAMYRVIQGFQLGTSTSFVPGPLCLTAQSRIVARRPLTLARATPAELVRQIELATGDALAITIGAFRTSMSDGGRVGGALGVEDRRLLGDAIAKRYGGMEPWARATVITVMPPSTVIPELEGLDDAIRAEPDADLLKLALLSRVESAEDSTLQRAKNSPDARLSAFATLLQDRLRDRGAGYATRLEAIRPTSE